jgi:hypothetical protein
MTPPDFNMAAVLSCILVYTVAVLACIMWLYLELCVRFT